MAILDVLRFPDERLRTVAAPVETITPELQQIVDDMFETMYAEEGIGLAATQVDIHQRIIVIDVSEDREDQLVLINPEITPLGAKEEDDWEGCLSVPGLRGVVPRWARIRYTGFDEKGTPIDRTVDGFHARVVQHECDHLIGKLYPMRVRDFSRFGFTEVLFPEISAAEDD